MLCTKCGKDFNTPDNRCPECGTVYNTTPPIRPSESDRFRPGNPSSEFIGHLMVRKNDGKGVNLLRILGVVLITAVICAVVLMLFDIL